MINYTGTYTDTYQLIMAQAYFLNKQNHQHAIFDYFFRKLPFSGGYAIFAGLEELLEILENLQFDSLDLEFLKEEGFDPEFLKYLKNFRFRGDVYACREGEVIFPNCPIVRVEANLIEAQLIETLLLNLLNFQTLIATKASRIRQVARKRKLIDFGLRRAQGPGGYSASRAVIIGGFEATSNVRAGRDYHIPISGTMAHAFVQSFDNEIDAFRSFAKNWPNRCVLLVDTYNTLESGIPNAIKVGLELEQAGHRLLGVRLDSGDLAYLANRARNMLDEAGLNYVDIIASNQLDEYVIKSLIEQGAPIDVFGVGTKLAVGWPDAALDGVYKLAFANDKPRMKLSESLSKISLPYKKQVHRLLEQDGLFFGADIISIADEKDLKVMHHPFESLKSMSLKYYQKEALLSKVMEQGKRVLPAKTLKECADYCQSRMEKLPMEYKRIINPHVYKVGLSDKLHHERNELIKMYQRKFE